MCFSLLLYLRVFSGQSRAFPLPCILKFDIAAGHLACLFAYFYLLKQQKSSCRHLSEEPVARCLWTEHLIKWCWTHWGNWRVRPKMNASISTKVGEPPSFAALYTRQTSLIEGNKILFKRKNIDWIELNKCAFSLSLDYENRLKF